MKRIIGFGIAVVLCALAGTASAQTYSNSLGINFSRGANADEGDPENHGALADTTADGYVAQTHWNNLNVSDPGSPVYLAATVDAQGNAVAAPAVSFSSIEWVMPTVDTYPKHGLLAPDQTASAANTLGYIGLGDFYDDNQMALTITDIPYTNYDVAVLEGWFENGVRWHVFKSDDANTWSGQDGWVGNPFTGSFNGHTFTFNGGDGHAVYAVQILSKDAPPAPSYTNAIGINLAENGTAGGGAVAISAGGHIDAYNTDFGYWNNLDGSGTFLNGPVDANNATVGGGFAVNLSGVTWQLPGQIFDNGPEKVGQAWPDNTPAAQEDFAYGGVGGGGDSNPTLTVTIPNIPYTSYDVAVLVGWFENNARWHLFKGNDANTWTGQDSWVGNPFTGSITGNTFTFNGGDGHGVYAIQILSKDAGGPGPGPANELVGHWPFDEGSGTNAFDATTNHLDGLLLGDPLPDWTSGIFSGALQFDGSHNEVVVADAPKLSPTGALTITAWVNPALASDGFTISKWSTDGLSGSYLLWVTPTNAEFNVFLNGTQMVVTGTNALTAATWHMVAGTYNGTNLTLYVDGVLNNSIAAQGALDVVTEPLRMGGLAGQLDDVRLYNYPLTSTEIAALYAASLNPTDDPDGDGIPTGWEVAHGLNPNDPNDAALDADGDGLTNLQEYQGNTDPQDYYNGVLPGLSIVSGNNQSGTTGTFLPQSLVVALTDAGSAPLNNAPVTFSVSQGQALLAATVNDTPLNALSVRTDANGQSAVVVLLPAQAGTNLVTVTATSGTNTSSVTFTAAAQAETTPEAGYSNSLGINFSRGTDAAEGDPHSHGALAPTTADGFVSQTHWNNLNVSDPGAPVYLAPTVDALGDAVPAPGVSFTSIEWVMPTVDVYPKHGLLYPDQTPATANTLGYIGLGDFYDGNQMSLTITDIPYATYDVAVLEGWFENGLRWHLFKGNDANTWSGQDALFGNTFTGSIVGSTFTFNGGDGHAVYAVQILSRDAIVPATTTTLSIKPSFYERNTGDLQLCQPPPAFFWSLVTPTP